MNQDKEQVDLNNGFLEDIGNDMIELFDSLGEDLDEGNLVTRLTEQAPRLREMEARYTQLKVFGDAQPRREAYIASLEKDTNPEDLLKHAWIQFCSVVAEPAIPRMAALMAPIFHIPILCRYLPKEDADGNHS